MPRLRLVADAFREIKETDPGTALTLCALRRMVRCGRIPVTKSGNRGMLDMETLPQYLSPQPKKGETNDSMPQEGEIRRVDA